MPDGDDFLDYYKLLGVTTHADADSIRAAFISKAKLHHPDVGGSTELMQQFTRAYRTLASNSSRRAYDTMHAFQTGKAVFEYRDNAKTQSPSSSELSDDEIDDFLDKIYAEYHNQPLPKRSFFTKIKNAL